MTLLSVESMLRVKCPVNTIDQGSCQQPHDYIYFFGYEGNPPPQPNKLPSLVKVRLLTPPMWFLRFLAGILGFFTPPTACGG